MTDISGRVDAIENQISFLSQDLLLRPDQNVYSSLLTTWNQQFAELSNSITQLNSLVRTLQSLYTNINRTVSLNHSFSTGVSGEVYTYIRALTGFSGVYGTYVNNINTFTGNIYSLFTGHTGLRVTGNLPLAHSG